MRCAQHGVASAPWDVLQCTSLEFTASPWGHAAWRGVLPWRQWCCPAASTDAAEQGMHAHTLGGHWRAVATPTPTCSAVSQAKCAKPHHGRMLPGSTDPQEGCGTLPCAHAVHTAWSLQPHPLSALLGYFHCPEGGEAVPQLPATPAGAAGSWLDALTPQDSGQSQAAQSEGQACKASPRMDVASLGQPCRGMALSRTCSAHNLEALASPSECSQLPAAPAADWVGPGWEPSPDCPVAAEARGVPHMPVPGAERCCPEVGALLGSWSAQAK